MEDWTSTYEIDEPLWKKWTDINFAFTSLVAAWWGWGMQQRIRYEETKPFIPVPLRRKDSVNG